MREGRAMKTPVAVCDNNGCEKVIYKGERIWYKGNEFYCTGKCLIQSFGNNEKELPGGM